MTCSSSPLKIYETEDDIPCGWYLHRFGHGQTMVIVLNSVTRLGSNICNSKRVSHKHVTVCLSQNGSWLIKDLKSKYGTYVNDRLVPEEGLTLQEWDVISLGRKRPKNNDEYGFMLKHKKAASCSSRQSSADVNDTSSSSLPAGLTDKVTQTKVAKKYKSEQESLLEVKKEDDNKKHIIKKGDNLSSTSLIVLSDSPSCSVGNDSEETVKNVTIPEARLRDVSVLPQKSISVDEKVGAWIVESEKSSTSSDRNSRRNRKKKHEMSRLPTEKLENPFVRRKATNYLVNYADQSDSSSSNKRQRKSDESSAFDMNSWDNKSLISNKRRKKANESTTSSDTNSWSNRSRSKTSSRNSKRYDTRKTQGGGWFNINDYFNDSKSDSSERGDNAGSSSESREQSGHCPDERSRKNPKRINDPYKATKNQKYYKDNDWRPAISKTKRKTKSNKRKRRKKAKEASTSIL